MDCRRCNFRADDLTEHAFDSGHMLCIVCQRESLNEREPQTCPKCIANVRADLADLLDDIALLEPRSVAAMTILGDGTMQRLMRDEELSSFAAVQHPLAREDESWPKPIRDEWPSDPLPVLPALASWEDFWRQDFGDPVGPPATLAGTIGYLMGNLDTGHVAAQRHHAFDEFAAEVRSLLSAVRHTAGLADDPLPAKAQCFECAGDLVRTYAPPVVTEDKRRNRATRSAATVLAKTKRQHEAERSYGIKQLTPWPILAARQQARSALLGESSEGLIDIWSCTRCRRTYTQTEYFIGLRVASSIWVPATIAADFAKRSIWTVRSWINRMNVTAACRVEDKTIMVWWPDVSDRAFRHADDAESRESA